jgi:hypothetical protein
MSEPWYTIVEKVHNRMHTTNVQKRQPLDPFLSQFDPVYTLIASLTTI